VKTFLGLVNYMTKFASKLAEISAPIRCLLTKDDFRWDAQQEQAFQQGKVINTQASVLCYFDPQTPLVFETDASKYRVESCLMQNEQPIAFASKSLTQTEISYAVIEKEMLAILFGLNRFHQYTYEREEQYIAITNQFRKS